jgi:hypothetical protein
MVTRQRGQRQKQLPRDPVVGTADGRMPDEQARIIRAELERLAGNPDLAGLTTEMVVEAAKDPVSPLHGFFTWDLAEAAAKQWLNEARRLIQSVRYVVVSQDTGEPVRVRSIVSSKIVDQNDEIVQHNGWIDRKALLRKKDTRDRFILRARSELRQWVLRYCDVTELTELRTLIREALGE